MNDDKILHLIEIADREFGILNYDDQINASRLFANVFANNLRYVVERKCWYAYDGRRWQADIGNIQVKRSCKVLAHALIKYAVTKRSDRPQMLDLARKWHKYSYREVIIKDAESVNAMSIDEFDSDPYLFNMKNGTLDLKTGMFREHDATDFITRCADFNYKNGVGDERFSRFIDEIMSGDEQRAGYLQKALGYAIGGTNEQECLFILYGATTRNGKSTLMESVTSVLGDYAKTANPETIAITKMSSATSPSEDVARLRGTRLVNISEPPQSLVLNAARVKTMTGSDTLTARFLHENSFEFKPQFKMYINTNHLPVINDTTLFSSNRIHIIPFERHFDEHEQDKHLKEYFADNQVKNAIGMWLVEGYFRYIGSGLTPPDSVKNATSEYEAASDKIKQFVDERLVRKAGEATPTSVVYAEYRNWCQGNGLQPLSQNKFSERLKRYGEIKQRRINGYKAYYISNYTLVS